MVPAGPQPGTLEAPQVRAMFDRIAGFYDLMNSVMTAGLHHAWRRRAVDLAAVGPGSHVLDVATGTGDLAVELASRVGPDGTVTGSDFSEQMLARARAKAPQLTFEWGNALELPYATGTYDAATVGFGARNFADLDQGLREMARVARLGVVVNDLDRTWLGWAGAWLLAHLLTADRYTRHDAPLSVRRAYRPEEMTGLLRAAGLVPVRTVRGAFGQRYAIAAITAGAAGPTHEPPDPQGAGE